MILLQERPHCKKCMILKNDFFIEWLNSQFLNLIYFRQQLGAINQCWLKERKFRNRVSSKSLSHDKAQWVCRFEKVPITFSLDSMNIDLVENGSALSRGKQHISVHMWQI